MMALPSYFIYFWWFDHHFSCIFDGFVFWL